MTEPSPLVSVIVPVYNSEKTIDRALSSVISQTYDNWELLVVNDASTDDSAALVRGIAASVPEHRILIIDSEVNRGSSAARNSGLDAATGEFVAFLDADDELMPDYLEALTTACSTGTDIVVCGHVVSFDDAKERQRSSRVSGSMGGRFALRQALADNITPFPWDKLYRRSLFNDLRYPAGLRRFEDMVMNLVLYPRARQVVVLKRPLYRYHVSAGSLTWGRVSSMDDARHAVAHLDAHLDASFRHGSYRAPFQTMLTLMTLLVAQSSAVSAPSQDGTRNDLRQYGAGLPLKLLADCLKVRPDLAVAGAVLKAAPALFGTLYRRYAAHAYGAQ